MRTTKPKLSILDKSFRYYSAADTSVARTFARIRRELAKQPVAKVTTLRKVAAK